MVTFRSISLSLISQLSILSLPEYPPPPPLSPFDDALANPDIATCYVPIYPGSQIWLSYAIEPPHQLGAAYFFKLLINGKRVTSWDSTVEQGYKGKVVHALEVLEKGNLPGKPVVRRRGLRFGMEPEGEDCIEVRVHRIGARRRIRVDKDQEQGGYSWGEQDDSERGLCFVNGGLLEPGCPLRRYKYQLLDSIDEPYATIRFHCQSYDFLVDRGIIPSQTIARRSSSRTFSGDWSDDSLSVLHLSRPGAFSDVRENSFSGWPVEETSESLDKQDSNAMTLFPPDATETETGSSAEVPDEVTPESLPIRALPFKRVRSGSEDSLRLLAKDSLESLHCQSSPQKLSLTYPFTLELPSSELMVNLPFSPNQQNSNLTIGLGQLDINPERPQVWRPLSPFTGGGTLRRLSSPEPHSAPATVTTYTTSEEKMVGSELQARKVKLRNSLTSGKSLLGFLGRKQEAYG